MTEVSTEDQRREAQAKADAAAARLAESRKAQTEPKAVVKTETKEDHLGMIAELANSLHNVSPSGAMTVRDKILEHIAAIQDPKAYDERIAADKKAEDEAEKIRAEERAKLKTPPADKAKVA